MSAGPLLEPFLRRATDFPSSLALWSRGEAIRLDWHHLATEVEALARELERHLPSQRPPVAVATGDGVAFVVAVLALWKLAAPVVAVDGGQNTNERETLCRRLGIGWLLTVSGSTSDRGKLHADPAPRTADHSPSRTDACFGRPMPGGLELCQLALDTPTLPPPETCLVKLTSGSTGEPVGSCFSAEALAHGIEHIGRGMAIDHRDVVLMAIPLSHSYGFDSGLLSLVALGTPLVLEPSRYPTALLQAVEESRCSVLPLVPPLVRALSQTTWPTALRGGQQPGGLRLVISAGGPLPADTAREFAAAAGVPVQQFYGSTESGGICFETRPGDPAAEGTVGFPLPGVEVELAADGRVEVRSPANYFGHFGQPWSNRPKPQVVFPGDRGEWTAEGRLRLLGRSVDILNVGGRKVAIAAVEEALRAVPGVREVAVIGVADSLRGDRIVAFVVADRERLDLTSVAANLVPRELRRVESLPYTLRGKLDRGELRRLATTPVGAIGNTPPATPVQPLELA